MDLITFSFLPRPFEFYIDILKLNNNQFKKDNRHILFFLHFLSHIDEKPKPAFINQSSCYNETYTAAT